MQSERIVRLYLPLLAHAEPAVRRQAGLVLLCSYGARARGYLQPLLRDSSGAERDKVRLALDTLALIDGQPASDNDAGEGYIQCLGRLQAHISGHVLALDNWDSVSSAKAGWQKVRRAFAYLVHCGRRGATRRTLMEAVWGSELGQSSLPRTLAALQQTMAHVAGNELAPRLLTVTDDHCMLNPDLYRSDVELFQNTYALAAHTETAAGLRAAAPLYAQAVDLYGGPYLADIGRASWAQERRDQLAGHYINGCVRLAEHAFRGGRYRQCLELCQQALDADMAADQVTVWLLRAYAALGRTAELTHAYAAYLRAVRRAPFDINDRNDPVVAEYELLAEARAVV